MSSSEFRPFTAEKPDGLMGADVTGMANVPAATSPRAGQSPVFDPRDGFFPRELLASDVPPSPLLRTAPRPARNSRLMLMTAVLAAVAALGYVVFNAQRAPGPGPANAVTPAPQAAKSNATATGSIAPAAASNPKQSASAVSAMVAVPVSPAPEAVRTPAIAPAVRTATESGRVPQAYAPAAKVSQSPVTHTKSAAAATVAPGIEVTQEPAIVRRPAMAPSATCTEAVAALGLCAAATKGENN